MGIFNKLQIGQRLALSFALVVALSLMSALLSTTRFDDLAHATKVLVSERMVHVRQAGQITDQTNLLAHSVSNLLLFREDSAIAKDLQTIQAAQQSIDGVFGQLQQSVTLPQARKLLAQTQQARQRFSAELVAYLKQVQARDLGDALESLEQKLRPSQLAYQKALDDFKDLEYARMLADGELAEASAQQSVLVVAGLAGLGLVLAVLGSVVATRSITQPVRQAVTIARTVASGALTSRIEVTRQDETGELQAALKAMNDSLIEVVGTVRQSSDAIATGATEIASGNADLSLRTEDQANNLQQAAAAIEQLSATVRQSADTAQQAAQMATTASRVATRGGQAVAAVVSTMDEISASSRKITEIIGVIDGIAFQTNILALNAAVEAARAGEQGRGFAVVASEVRSLAGRSAEAAKEIKQLIAASVAKVETGSQQVGQAGQTMDDIVTQVQRVSEMLGEISVTTREQTTGIGQVRDSVNQLDQVTQQNAALVEQSAAAAESLRLQASRLVEVVGVFKLG
jgi:methyl-accepting chemotaxis protein